MTNTLENREFWLTKLATLAIPHMEQAAGLRFGKWRVTCGFPSRGGMAGTKRTRIGECWNPAASNDQTAEVLISPLLAQPDDVCHVLVHELIHVALPGAGHGKPFQRAAKALGLLKPYTATSPGEAFWPWMRPLLDQLGSYPHAALRAIQVEGAPKKQKNRYFKAECVACGYSVRLTRKWHEDVGAPHCPGHGAMQVDIPGNAADDDRADDAKDCAACPLTSWDKPKDNAPYSFPVHVRYDNLLHVMVA